MNLVLILKNEHLIKIYSTIYCGGNFENENSLKKNAFCEKK